MTPLPFESRAAKLARLKQLLAEASADERAAVKGFILVQLANRRPRGVRVARHWEFMPKAPPLTVGGEADS